MNTPRTSMIVSILPKDEGFSPQRFGAISLCVRDFTLHSRYRDSTTVISGVSGAGFEGIAYNPARKARWYENRTRAYARHCVRIIRETHAQLAEIHNRPRLLLNIARKTRCKLALHLHNDPQEMRDAKTPAQREYLLSQCAAIYCVSQFIRKRFLEGLPQVAGQKVHVIYNGIRLNPPATLKEPLIIYAGRMTEGKGVSLLAQALARALPRLPDWRAVLIGSDRHSASAEPTIRELAIDELLQPVQTQAQRVGFCSHEETMDYFQRAAIAVIPSLWQEPFGRTAIEAMASGCALISSGRGALREVTGEAALTPTDMNVELLSQAIVSLAKNTGETLRLQQAGQERVKRFEIAHCAAALDTVRERLFNGNM